MIVDDKKNELRQIRSAIKLVVVVICITIIVPIYLIIGNPFSFIQLFENQPITIKTDQLQLKEESKIVDGIDIETGLKATEGYEIVKVTCTRCHSAKLVTQNRATREGWVEMIRWMQKTQGLWQLGTNEKPILDYLEKNYAPENNGRRKPLAVQNWYELK